MGTPNKGPPILGKPQNSEDIDVIVHVHERKSNLPTTSQPRYLNYVRLDP